ncbi:MAG: YceD family protein, partial [Methylococcaceae bacterium]
IMTGTLPELIDPLEFVDKRKRIHGELSLSRMARLEGMILNPEDKVRLDLSFMREDRYSVISGHIEATLILECQCCLEPMDWPVACELRLGIVSSVDESARLPDSLEPFLLTGDPLVSVSDLIEDELLLAIPPVPQHSVCVSVAESARNSSRSAFAVLAQLQGKI